MSRPVARRPWLRVRSMLGHPFGLGLVLGLALFVTLWALGALSDGRNGSAASRTGTADPRAEPTARALPPPASGLPAPSGSSSVGDRSSTGDGPSNSDGSSTSNGSSNSAGASLGSVPANEPGGPRPALSPAVEDIAFLRLRALLFPVPQANRRAVRDDFGDPRTGHAHEALDILAPRGTEVVAVDDGVVQKLFTSVRGGLTVYHFDPEGAYSYYYAHLDRYADGLREGQPLRKGDLIGYVGTTGNAPPQTPHLHFAIFKLGPEKLWWKGAALNPFPIWAPPVGRAG